MDLVPVDHDPFANAPPPAVPNGVTLQPVDHDPWAPYVNPETGRPEISVSKAPAEGVVAKSGQSIAQPSVAEQVAGFPQRAADMTIGALGPIGEAGMTVGDMLRTGHVDPRDIPQVAGGVMLGVAAPEAEEAAPLEAGAEAVGKGLSKEVAEYAGQHGAPDLESGSPLHDVTANGIYPKDFYGPNGFRYYAPGNEGDVDRAAYNKIVSLKDKPDQMVSVYRAIPWEGKLPNVTLHSGGPSGAIINPGDWVTLSRQYANDHGASALNGQYALVDKKVPARELFTAGDSFHEWGWDPRASAPVGAAPATVPQGITAYHGSPYDFDKFDLSKIGTGEGAQAYGHGLYFAENPATAQAYKEALGGPEYLINGNPPADNIEATAARYLASSRSPTASDRYQDAMMALDLNDSQFAKVQRGLPPDVSSAVRQQVQQFRDADITNAGGKTYQVSINADPEHFLDWDKPLSEQSPQVQAALAPIQQSAAKSFPNIKDNTDVTGHGLVNAYAQHRGGNQVAVTDALRQAGIPGIKYMDQGSRGQTRWIARHPLGGINDFSNEAEAQAFVRRNPEFSLEGPKQTKNYVVFDDKLIDIIKKYGLAGLIAGGASHFATQPVDHDPFAARSQ